MPEIVRREMNNMEQIFLTARHSRNQTLSYAFKLSALSNQL